MKRMFYLSCALVGALMLSVPVEAGTILQNDFNTNTAGVTLANGATWSGADINLVDNSSTTNPSMTSDPFDPDVVSNPLIISFDYKLKKNGGANHSFEVKGGATQGILMDMSSAQKIRYRKSSGFVDLIDGQSNNTKIQFNTWYNFELTLSPENAGTKAWDLVVTRLSDSFTMVDETALEFRNQIANYDTARWFMNVGAAVNNGAEYEIDNLLIETVPEPASLSMLALAGMALTIVRRRIRSA